MKLNSIYIDLLKEGMLFLKIAKDQSNQEWINAEIVHLHNIPSLINCDNIHRHLYYFNDERVRYSNVTMNSGCDLWKQKMAHGYLPIWNKLVIALEDYEKECSNNSK